MPRPPRHDAPGTLYHAMNRSHEGLDALEDPAARAYLLGRIALLVAEGLIRIHVLCFMRNHFHLLVESLTGNLSEAMQRIQGPFGIWFNLRSEHRGHVFGQRFKALAIRTIRYLFTVIRYIDLNPVVAGIVTDPLVYESGTARLHVERPGAIPWLSNEIIDAFLTPALLRGLGRREAYAQVFGPRRADARTFPLVKARLEHPDPAGEDPIDVLDRPGFRWIDFLRSRVITEPRTTPPLPAATVDSVRETIAQRTGEAARGPWRKTDVHALEAGLLRDVAGLGWTALGDVVRASGTSARRRYERHRRQMAEDPTYAHVAAELARLAVLADFDVPELPDASAFATLHGLASA